MASPCIETESTIGEIELFIKLLKKEGFTNKEAIQIIQTAIQYDKMQFELFYIDEINTLLKELIEAIKCQK